MSPLEIMRLQRLREVRILKKSLLAEGSTLRGPASSSVGDHLGGGGGGGGGGGEEEEEERREKGGQESKGVKGGIRVGKSDGSTWARRPG